MVWLCVCQLLFRLVAIDDAQAVGFVCRANLTVMLSLCSRVKEFLKDFAANHGLRLKQDAVGNTVIFRPGSGGGESAWPVIHSGELRQPTVRTSHYSSAVRPLLISQDPALAY